MKTIREYVKIYYQVKGIEKDVEFLVKGSYGDHSEGTESGINDIIWDNGIFWNKELYTTKQNRIIENFVKHIESYDSPETSETFLKQCTEEWIEDSADSIDFDDCFDENDNY